MLRAIRIVLFCATSILATAIAILMTLAVILPGVAHDARFSRETAAVKAIAMIHTAQVRYYAGNGRFAGSMQELGPSEANLIGRDLAKGEMNGYRFTLQTAPAGYTIRAVPTQFGVTGTRTYLSDEDMGIHMHIGPEPATADDPLLGETARQKEAK